MPETSAREQALRPLETQLETLAREICDAWLILSEPSNCESPIGVQRRFTRGNVGQLDGQCQCTEHKTA
jgi:hypothetical protein